MKIQLLFIFAALALVAAGPLIAADPETPIAPLPFLIAAAGIVVAGVLFAGAAEVPRVHFTPRGSMPFRPVNPRPLFAAGALVLVVTLSVALRLL